MTLVRQVRCWVASVVIAGMHHAAAEYRFDVWTTDSGLPHNTVNTALQSRDGYLWIGTPDGLARFDGMQFVVFNKANSPGLPGNRIRALHEDREGDLWIGLQEGGLVRYRQGSFKPITGLPIPLDTPISNISGDHLGNLWIFQRNDLLRWTGQEWVPDLPRNQPAFDREQLFGWNPSGLVWATSHDALQVYLRGKLITLNVSNGLPTVAINKVDEDRHGSLWLATEDSGLIQARDGQIVKVYTQKDGLPRNRIRPIPGFYEQTVACEDRKGNLWVSGAGPWLGRLKDGVFTAYPSSNTLSSQALPSAIGMPGSVINVLYEDAEANLWIGTEGSGLIRARDQVVNVLSSRHGLQAANVYPILEDSKGVIWLGSWDKGLIRYENGRVTNFDISPRLVTALCEDRAGQLWVGTFGQVVLFRNGAIQTNGVPRALSQDTVSAILEDQAGTMFFGGERGLYKYQNGEVSSFTKQDGLAGDRITVIVETRSSALWIGTRTGLTRLAKGRFTTWTERDGLPSNHLLALYEDQEDTIWIGTADGGLGRFKNGKFTSYTTKEGMFDNGVFQILEDRAGNFWMSSNRGIHRVNKRELNEFAEGRRRSISSVAYGKSDGLQNAECNGGRWPAGIKARDGKLWFPTQAGVAVIDPGSLSINTNPPPVVIEAFVLDRRAQALDHPLRVPPGKSHIEIQYSGLSFINSERLSFKYRLTPGDEDWIEAGTRRAAYYWRLAPGRYTFTALAANSDGVWSATGAVLPFVVLPAWHQTAWFRCLAALALAGAIFGLYRHRIAQLETQRTAQQNFSRRLIQSQEQERKRIAAELHDSLGQNLLVIKNRAAIGVTAGAWSAPEQFSQISRAAAEALEEVREIAQNLRPYQLDRLGLTRALHALIKKVITSSKVNCVTDIEPVDRIFAPEAEINFYRIVQEGLNNILKHSGATQARVTVKHDESRVRLLIEDNGRGFDHPTVHHPNAANGMGLSGITERVRILGGKLNIRSSPGSGTQLDIELPILMVRKSD
jgi:signal transduction histidine kinase/ligand-binding sensor domain-containing protein